MTLPGAAALKADIKPLIKAAFLSAKTETDFNAAMDNLADKISGAIADKFYQHLQAADIIVLLGSSAGTYKLS